MPSVNPAYKNAVVATVIIRGLAMRSFKTNIQPESRPFLYAKEGEPQQQQKRKKK